MNREIKFRAWYRDQKQMAFDDKTAKFDIEKWKGIKGSCIEILNGLCDGSNQFVLMQFVGEANGVEVYEGDITDRGYLIRWSEEKCLFCQQNYWPQLSKWSEASYPMDLNNIKIVGNVFQNPELLNFKMPQLINFDTL